MMTLPAVIYQEGCVRDVTGWEGALFLPRHDGRKASAMGIAAVSLVILMVFVGLLTAVIGFFACGAAALATRRRVVRHALTGALFGFFIFPWVHVLASALGRRLHPAASAVSCGLDRSAAAHLHKRGVRLGLHAGDRTPATSRRVQASDLHSWCRACAQPSRRRTFSVFFCRPGA